MPIRRFPLVTGETYHVFNRSIARFPIFTKNKDFQRFLDTTDFYRFVNTPVRFSHLNRLGRDLKESILSDLHKNGREHVEIYAFALMPNHFHFLLKQTADNGLGTFIGRLQNSYAKYLDTKDQREGAVFQSMFKAKRIETEEQLLHVQRYIHLNPVTSYIVKDPIGLVGYPWTSLPHYLEIRTSPFIHARNIMQHFANREKFKEFIFNQVDYQRTLERIKHLLFE